MSRPVDLPTVSIVTPTIPGREKVLLNRCIPSVLDQDWPGLVEHVIVSDVNPDLRTAILTETVSYPGDDPRYMGIQFVEINDTWKNPTTRAANGVYPWMIGSRLALGDFIGFLGDDDALLPYHISTHINAMRMAGAMWSLSKVEFRAGGELWREIGDDSYIEGHLDANGIMCYKDALKVATWDPTAGIAAGDWLLVHQWRQASLVGTFIDKVTATHHDGWLTGMTGKPYD